MQDKWAALLGNMVDSEQNIQNHVFPYLLSQISRHEFETCEKAWSAKKYRVDKVRTELEIFKLQRPQQERVIKDQLFELGQGNKVDTIKKWKLEGELKSFDHTEKHMIANMEKPETITDSELKEFELSNLIRLGIIRQVTENSVSAEPITIPRGHVYEFEDTRVSVDIGLESQAFYELTELGELFFLACNEKKS